MAVKKKKKGSAKAKEKKKPAKMSGTKRGKTYTNPDNSNQTYTIGQRGRIPFWVVPLIEKG